MKLYWSFLSLLIFMLCALPTDVQAVVSPVKSTEVVENVEDSKLSKKELRKKARMERKKAKLKKKLDRITKKLEKRAKKKGKSLVNLWNDSKFRLGILLLIAALAVGILSILISLGGLINFIAGLLALGGVIFLIWSLVENFG